MSFSSDEIQRALDEADCLATPAQVEAAIERVAGEVSERLRGSNPLVYCVLNGGLIFTGRLLHKLNFPLELAYLHATRYGAQLHGTELEWKAPPSQSPEGRTVLIVDDILDEGHTLAAIEEHVKQAGAVQVSTAVLVHKCHERKARPGMRADFTGLELEDRYLFGCGMDVQGYWRNAPGIYALKGY